MRRSSFTSTAVAAMAFMLVGALVPLSVMAQQPPSDQQDQPPAPPKPYKPVPIQLPKPVNDPTFDTFRKQLAGVAEKKDRTALTAMVAKTFFWIPEDRDVADKAKSGIDNLAKAVGLDGRDPPGWELLASFAGESSAEPNSQRPGVICGPGEASFDESAAEQLAKSTDTDPSEWGYPSKDGVEVHSGPESTSPVVAKLGLHLVRVYPDDSPAGAVHGDVLRIVAPSGKLGYVPVDIIYPLVTDQLCYTKEGNAWKITGLIGGEPPAQ